MHPRIEDVPNATVEGLGFAGALVLSAIVGGTLIGSALAQDGETDADTANCDTFMDTFMAAELGVSRDEVVDAGKAAANAASMPPSPPAT